MQQSARFGIISTATIGKKVIKAIKSSNNATVVALGGRSLEKTKAFAEETGINK